MALIPSVLEFAGEYAFLSNFHPSPFTITTPDSQVFYFATVEHAYQAFKTQNPIEFMKIVEAKTPGEAKRLGRNVYMRHDWERIKERVMITCVRAKFSQNEHLAKLLIETHPMELIEGNRWNDTYWGVCKGVGKNRLGAILMAVREEIMKMAETQEVDGQF